jgi:hypothetical protein
MSAEDGTTDGLSPRHLTYAAGMTSQGTTEGPRTLMIALDAVPFRVIEAARKLGAFADWAPPSAVVAPFPTVTHVAFASLFQPFGVPPSLGYELRHFDTDANATVGGGVFDYATDRPAWFEFFDLPHRSLAAELANYVSPRGAARHAVDEIERELLDAATDVFLAYIGATDGLMHIHGDAHMVELLVELDRRLVALRERHQQARNRPLRIVLFSDHGCGSAKIHHVEGLDHLLREAGLHVVAQLRTPDDVVAPKFGLVNYGALFLQDADRAGAAAAAVARHEAVDVAAFSPAPDTVEVISRAGTARVHWRGTPGATQYRYEDWGGDPLRLASAQRRLEDDGAVDGAGYAADDDWLRVSASGYFPDALRRLREALTGDRVRSRADVLFSFGPTWAGGWHSAVVGAWVRGGRLAGTHGGLDRESSLGFFLVDDAAFALPSYVRADSALAHFADLLGP